jgi:hypothetical protein
VQKKVELCDVTRDPSHTTLLKHLEWKQAKIRFSFVRDLSVFNGADDLRIEEALRSDFDEFQMHKKILCVIGILHCPSCSNIGTAYQAFKQSIETQFGIGVVHRCFAMEPVTQSDGDLDGNIVVIPECDEDKTRFYLHTLMQVFRFLQTFSSSLTHYFKGLHVHLIAPI